jgi:hypothetical protein
LNNPPQINLYEVKKIGVSDYMHTRGDRESHTPAPDNFPYGFKKYESHYMINSIYTDLAVNWAKTVRLLCCAFLFWCRPDLT